MTHRQAFLSFHVMTYQRSSRGPCFNFGGTLGAYGEFELWPRRLGFDLNAEVPLCGPKSCVLKISLVASIFLTSFSAMMGLPTADTQGAPQTVEIARVNLQKVPAGFRASKVIGSSVFDDANENVGKVDDLLVNPQGGAAFAGTRYAEESQIIEE